jgi:cell division protein FtsL
MKEILLLLITIAVLLMAVELTYLSWTVFKIDTSLQKELRQSIKKSESNTLFNFF